MNLAKRIRFTKQELQDDIRLDQLCRAYEASEDHEEFTNTDGDIVFLHRSMIEDRQQWILRRMALEELGVEYGGVRA